MSNETTGSNGKPNGVPTTAAGVPGAHEWAKSVVAPSGAIHVDGTVLSTVAGAAVRRAAQGSESYLDPSDPADALLLEQQRRAVQRADDQTQRVEHDVAALRGAEAERDAVGPAPARPSLPWLIVAVLVAASGMVSTITFHAAFGLPSFPTNPAKAMTFGLVFGLAVTGALVGAPFKAVTYEQPSGLWRWAPLLAGTGGLGWALFLIRNAQTASGYSVSVGLALMEGIIILIAEGVAHVYGKAWKEYRTLAKAFAKAEGIVATARRQLEEAREVLTQAEQRAEALREQLAGRQARARARERAMEHAHEEAEEGVRAAVLDTRGRVLGNTWRRPTEAEALERLGGKKEP